MLQRNTRYGLLHDRRGASLVEYLIVLGLVALVCIGGYKLFGKSAKDDINAQADCVQTLSGCHGSVHDPSGGNLPAGMDFANPPFKGVKDGDKAEYKPAKGTPFNQGKDAKQPQVNPKDISQGQIGDCWFMSSMAAIARKNPGVIKNGIKDLGDGKYEVTLYEPGTFYGMNPVKVVVTNDFPQNKDGSWRFAQPGNLGEKDGDNNQKLWPMLYEKAYAQRKGGYEKMVGGSGAVGMESITGVRSDTSSLKGRFWDMSFSDFEDIYDNNAVTASSLSKDDGKKKQYYKDGKLVSNHAYWVDSIDRKNQTVTVRNPWGWNEPTVTLTWDEFKNNFSQVQYNKTK